MYIRKAIQTDIPGLNKLLHQVLTVHHQGRPDLFKAGVTKYTDDELSALLRDSNRPIFVAVDEHEEVLGYAFCIFQQKLNDNILTNIRTLYIDDLCVDEACRGQHIGSQLYQYVLDFAKKEACYNVTLNVWGCNESALAFYRKCGLKVQKIGLETIL